MYWNTYFIKLILLGSARRTLTVDVVKCEETGEIEELDYRRTVTLEVLKSAIKAIFF